MKRKTKTTQKIKTIVKNYVINNYKEYLLVGAIFIIGLFIGVIIVNNYKEENLNNVSNYINDFVVKLKESNNISKNDIIIESIKNNTLLAIVIWFAGTTIIGIPVVLGMIGIRGVSLGYTISACTYSLGVGKGILFNLSALLLQNILFIPAIFTLGVSSIKLYKSILKDRRRENIKIEILRHTIISLIMLGVLITSSFVENIISMFILQKLIKYF